MEYEKVKKNIWTNFLTNYFRTIFQMLISLYVFRMLFQNLTREEFGFWVLLWSIVGYGRFLDFGLGFTIQKRVAEFSAHKKWESLKKVIDTVICAYLVIALVILFMTMTMSSMIMNILQISVQNREYFLSIFIYFFLWVGISYPLGILPEILVGQQRIHVLNMIQSVVSIVNAIFITIAIYYNLGLKILFTVTLSSMVINYVTAGLFAFRFLSKIPFFPPYFSFKILRETMHFSLYAYLNTTSNIILQNFDRLIISIMLAVSELPIYQAGAKVADLFSNFTNQLSNTLSPASAHLHAIGDKGALKDLLIKSTRYSTIIATPLYLICAFYMNDLLKLLTGETHPSWNMYLVGQIMALWKYSTGITHDVFKNISMMSGHEKRLARIGISEAFFCFLLTISLVSYFQNIISVSLGLLLPALYIGWRVLWVWTASEVGLTTWNLTKTVVFSVWRALLPMIAFIILMKWIFGLEINKNFIYLVVQVLLSICIGLWGLWLWALDSNEKKKVYHFMEKYFNSKGI